VAVEVSGENDMVRAGLVRMRTVVFRGIGCLIIRDDFDAEVVGRHGPSVSQTGDPS